MTGDPDRRITVVTAAYNRADTLPRLYDSLVAQTYKGLRWLVVDDGSTDDTPNRVEVWRRSAPFPIEYVRQDNAGKHVALNRAVALVQTEMLAIIDSDDWYLPEGLETLLRRWDEIPAAQRPGFADVEGRSVDQDGALVGTPLPAAVVDSDHYEMRVQRPDLGDTRGLWRTDVLREHPFPEDLGRFVTESIVLHRIAARYRTRFCSDLVGGTEYRAGGLSDQVASGALSAEAAPARLVYLRELLGYRRPMPPATRVRTQANEVRYALLAGQGLGQQWRETPRRLGWALAVPLGVVLHARDRRGAGAAG